MSVWVVTEGDCDCCMYVTVVLSTREKAIEYVEKTDSRYTDISEAVIDEVE